MKPAPERAKKMIRILPRWLAAALAVAFLSGCIPSTAPLAPFSDPDKDICGVWLQKTAEKQNVLVIGAVKVEGVPDNLMEAVQTTVGLDGTAGGIDRCFFFVTRIGDERYANACMTRDKDTPSLTLPDLGSKEPYETWDDDKDTQAFGIIRYKLEDEGLRVWDNPFSGIDADDFKAIAEKNDFGERVGLMFHPKIHKFSNYLKSSGPNELFPDSQSDLYRPVK
jgi:hypothetical protein